jgi:hypothetical protein
MKPGYSRLLVNECIIPEQTSSRFMTIAGMSMTSLEGWKGRRGQYRELLEAAGLKVG